VGTAYYVANDGLHCAPGDPGYNVGVAIHDMSGTLAPYSFYIEMN
jgi:hypothetical protein